MTDFTHESRRLLEFQTATSMSIHAAAHPCSSAKSTRATSHSRVLSNNCSSARSISQPRPARKCSAARKSAADRVLRVGDLAARAAASGVARAPYCSKTCALASTLSLPPATSHGAIGTLLLLRTRSEISPTTAA
jgi:hypothetical protein